MVGSLEQSRSHTIVLALLASVLLHASMVLIAFRVPASLVVSSDIPEIAHNTQLVKLGEAKPSPIKVTWLGATEESEHQVTKSSTTQMEQDIGGELSESVEVEQSQAELVQQAKPIDIRLTVSAQALAEELAKTTDVMTSLAERLALAVTKQLATAQEQLEQQRNQAEKEQAQREREQQQREDAERTALVQQANPPSGNEGPGNGSRESDASSENEPLRWEPGKPLSAEGVRITTYKPKFTTTTLLSTSPSNPIVDITFGSNGEVVRRGVRFVGRGTGYPDVDRPLIEAMYLWKATGRKIDELRETETLSIKILVILR
ncbi:MAG: hypothetical protein H6815_11025 [Phycisphaeraceae bacterium]|nr:hypothetical protein [Phycisphaerales bacterium]MCB9860968.1 hypothetical protein [Phycisphaeraceae bacterium]